MKPHERTKPYTMEQIDEHRDEMVSDHVTALFLSLTNESYDACAISLGIKVGTYKSRLSRARDRLRRCINAKG